MTAAGPAEGSATPGPFPWTRNLQLFLSAQVLGSTGVWMLRMAKDWLVLELTGSPAAVGVVVALQFLPLMLVGPLGGVVADRYDKRRLVMLTQTAAAVVAVALAALTLAGAVQVWHIWVMAVCLGLIAAVEMPSRQVLVNEVVGDTHLRPAISLTNALNQGGGLIGPALAGIVIAEVGQGWTFGLNALVCLCVVLLVAAIRAEHLHRVPTVPRARGQLREGMRFVVSRPHLLWVVVLAGFLGAFGLNGPVVLAAFADQVWDTGARGFGLYNSVSAAGALVGAVVAARIGRLRLRALFIGAAAFGVTEAIAAAMPTHATFIAMLVVVGAATLFFLTAAASYVQLGAEPHVRGRVMAIYSPMLLGGHAFGGLVQGWLAETLGVRWGLAVTGGLAVLATGAVALGLMLHTRRVTRRERPAPPPAHDPTDRRERGPTRPHPPEGAP